MKLQTANMQEKNTRIRYLIENLRSWFIEITKRPTIKNRGVRKRKESTKWIASHLLIIVGK